MSRTQDRFYADKPHNGGWLFFGAPQLIASSANLVMTRNAQFDWSFNRVSAGAETYQVVWNCSNLRRIIESYQVEGAFQEPFAVGPPLAGRPPYTGFGPLTPPATAGPAKGIQIDDVAAVYQVGVAGLTAASLALAEAKYANAVANSFVAQPLNALALPLIVQATPYVVTRAVLAPSMIVDDLSDLVAEFAFTMANTGTIRVYGIGVHCHFNYD